MKEIDMIRTNHLIDPKMHIWGWEVPVDLFLGGLTAGIMIVAAIFALRNSSDKLSKWMRWMPFAAPIILSFGMLALFLDLEHKAYVWRFYLAFEVSAPISWGSWILLLIYPVSIVFGIMNLTPEEREAIPTGFLTGICNWIADAASGCRNVVLWLNILLGAGLGTYTGIFLGSLGARALWSSPLMGPLFLLSGISTAMALMIMFPLKDDERHSIVRWNIGAIVVQLMVIGLYVVGQTTSGAADKMQAMNLILGGEFTNAFWGLVVCLGLAVPLVLMVIGPRVKALSVVAAPVLILVGGFAMRWILVFAGQVKL